MIIYTGPIWDGFAKAIRVGVSAGVLLFAPLVVEGVDVPRLRVDSQGHTGEVKELLFTPDGSQLISMGNDKVIRIWDVGSGRLVDTIRCEIGDRHFGKLYAADISPDGRWLAVGGYLGERKGMGRGDLRFFDLPKRELVRVIPVSEYSIHSIDFSDDGSEVAVADSSGWVRVYRPETILGAPEYSNVAELMKPDTFCFLSHTEKARSIYCTEFSSDAKYLSVAALEEGYGGVGYRVVRAMPGWFGQCRFLRKTI